VSYGPVVPLLQLPAAAFSHPIAAVVVAGILNEAILLLPLLALARQGVPSSPAGRASGVLIVAALQSAMMHVSASAYWLGQIQVDAFAMGLAILGMAALLGADPAAPLSKRRIWSSAVLFGAAVFSKQNEFCLVAVFVVYIGARDGARAALGWILAAAAAGAAGLLLLVAFSGWNAVFLNMWLVPTKHPMGKPGVQGIAEVGGVFLEQLAPFVAVALSFVLVLWKVGPRHTAWRPWLLASPWILPAAAAGVMLPISVLGGVKVGGDVNSNHSLYYLAASITLLAARLSSVERPVLPFLAAASTLAAVVALLVQPHPPTLDGRGSRLERELAFSKAHPEEIWFGANPLVTLYTDRKLYHQGYGIYDRTLPKMSPSSAHLAKFLPSRMKWVATPGSPFWTPAGLVPIQGPPDLWELKWYERSPAR